MEEALRADQYYVNNRWLGGMLTNRYSFKGMLVIRKTNIDEQRR